MSGFQLCSQLPPFACPEIFDISGGTRLVCVIGGPGKRMALERSQGKCELSNSNPDAADLEQTERYMLEVVKALPSFIRELSLFRGAQQDTWPSVYHDGAAKSMASFDAFTRMARYGFNNMMKDGAASLDQFWASGLNHDIDVVKPVILFCSNESLNRILRGCNLATSQARFLAPSGGIAVVNIPVGAQPSVMICAGPFAPHAMQWGTVTQAEYTQIHGGASASASASGGGDSDSDSDSGGGGASGSADAGIGGGSSAHKRKLDTNGAQ